MPGWLDDIDLHNKIGVSRDTRSSIGARYLETKYNAWMVCFLDFSQKGDDDLIWYFARQRCRVSSGDYCVKPSGLHMVCDLEFIYSYKLR